MSRQGSAMAAKRTHFVKIGTIALMSLIIPMMQGCRLPGRSGTPSGQVVAIVDGKEITLQQLRAELSSKGGAGGDPRAQERGVLQTITDRRLIADHARKMGLEKTPQYTVALARAEDALLAQYYQEILAQQTPQPTDEEVEQFKSSHPNMFARRMIYSTIQIQYSSTDADKIATDIRPMKTLTDIEAYLKMKGIDYVQSSGMFDTSKLQPKVVELIASVPSGEPFAFRAGDGTVVDQITSSREAPLQGEDAVRSARALMHADQVHDAVTQGIDAVLKQGRPKVQYNPRFLASIKQPQAATGHP